MRGAWIEINLFSAATTLAAVSRPMRGAWIEIFGATNGALPTVVAPHAGRVD